ncbi:MAG: YceI family protein [Anaerolineae bacterium]
MQSVMRLVLKWLTIAAAASLSASPVACRPGSAGMPATPQQAAPVLSTPVEWAAAAPATETPSPIPSPTVMVTPTSLPRPKTGKMETFSIVPDETTLTYTVTQVLLGEAGRQEVVRGKTRQVSGQFTLNYDDPANSSFGMITANLNTLQSGDKERDAALRENWLEFARFPLAYFMITDVVEFPDDFRPAEPVNFQLLGDLTLKGVSRPAVWDTTAALYLDRLKGTATTFLRLSDYDLPVPGVPGVIEVTDGITVTLEFVARMVEPPPLPGGA